MRALLVAAALPLSGCSCGIGWGGTFCGPSQGAGPERPAPWTYLPSPVGVQRFCRTDGSECRTLDARVRREIDAAGRP